MIRTHTTPTILGLVAALAVGGNTNAQSILVLNGTGTSTVSAPLTAAGFNVVSGTLDPGQIAMNLAAVNDIVEIWIWNDGTYGNTYSPADPLRDFDALDLAALDAFRATHTHWIMDCLAWRSHLAVDEQNLSMNEAIALAAAGGGIVLGTDDDSGAALVQHVNQIAAHVGFAPFVGTYDTSPAVQYSAGSFFTTPSAVNPTGVGGSQSYCDAPWGYQPNGVLLSTALFGSPGIADPLFPSPALVSDTFNGTLYTNVDHLITTSLPGAGFQPPTIVVLNGTGTSSVEAPLTAAGFNVVAGTLDAGQISSALSANPNVVELWIWNDGTFGGTFVPADPLRYFDAGDLAALDAFSAAHPHWIMDGLAWRPHTSADEIALSTNEALQLAASGGGIVLGADDDSGGAIVQHVNQVAAHFGFAPWAGTYLVAPTQQIGSGSLVASPAAVNTTGLTATTSQCDVPNGPQPSGMVLTTAIMAAPCVDYPGYTNAPLADEVLGGVLYLDVDHLVTTTIPGGGFRGNTTTTYCFGDGSGTSCPCGNTGNVGSGCDNSVGTGGGRLVGAGTASVGADTFELDGSGMPFSATALYFQGTVALNAAQGVHFGDGLRCVGGTVIRLGTRTNVGGTSGYGGPLGDVPISVRGLMPAVGGTRTYQAWYRDSAPFCTPSAFNLTNAVATTWVP